MFVSASARKLPAHPKEFDRLSRADVLKLKKVAAVATLEVPAGNGYDDFVIVSSLEVCAAPNPLPPDIEGKDPTKEVSWGYLASAPSLSTQLVAHAAPGKKKPLRLVVIDLAEILRTSFKPSDHDRLWPWAFRVTAFLLNRYAQVLSTTQGVIRLKP